LKRLLYQFHVDFKDRSKNVFGESFDRVSVGEYWKHSTTFAKAYCERYGIDYKFEFLSEEEYTPWAFGVETFDKYRAIQYLDEYDQVLYVDTDVIIHPNADNIFEEFKDKGLVGYFDNIADRYIHNDNYSIGKINSGVILYNNYNKNLNGGQSKMCAMNIYSAHWPCRGTDAEEYILKRYRKGKWWTYWEEKHSENITYLKNKTPSDENFFHYIVNLYTLLPFHIGRKYNYRKNFKEKPLVRHGSGMIETSPSFIHYEGATKSLIHKDFEEGLFFE
jgi:lipopolysaccharide biosynthesis glycosyltransferase